MPNDFTIAQCPPAQRTVALRLLHDGLPPDQQTALVHALDASRGDDESIFDGLFIASDKQELLNAAWVQLAPGKTAVLWPPALGNPTANALMQAANTFLDQHHVALAQILADADQPLEEKLLTAGNFQKLANLVYLTLESSHFPQTAPAADLAFEPRALDHPERLGKLLIATYKDSLDCPALNGIREPDDIVAGYAAQGTVDANQWYFLRHADQDVGALILTSHAEGQHWELVYMGITPAARGQGFGWQTLQHALWQAQQATAARMVLAVDETNEHAIRTYRQAGFVVWDRKAVYARLG